MHDVILRHYQEMAVVHSLYRTRTNFCEWPILTIFAVFIFTDLPLILHNFSLLLHIIIYLCFRKKDMKEASEGADSLLNISYSLDGHFGHFTSLYQYFRGLKIFTHCFQSTKSAKVSSRKKIVCILFLIRIFKLFSTDVCYNVTH